ncbi:WS/DGAT/MGAT family acyltransferase [Inhella inkyongensis]|uniref:diacylglycerol O-acyltransferase n=1 Tax=Inhella inkyongensis TaxID=392593 RepID=A0A840S2V5_9BURK|nr:wax ester/triacylglycerol synthase family O-acyltransferase [Inhella inkyongensis]MBB5204645.1 WS/DGAT/MGAT family acyltransferase [Inhella inkyongensis]
MSQSPERMSRVDTAWLRMDTPENLMMIVGVWFLKPRLSLEALQARCTEKLLPYRRFRQKVVEDVMGAHWVEDPEFDIANHVQRVELEREPGQTAMQALQAHVALRAAQPLDPRQPLWAFELFEDVDGESVLLARIHHCIGDGIALISVMLSITDGGALPPKRRSDDENADEHEGEHDWIVDHLIKPITDMTVKTVQLASKGAAKSMDLLIAPDTPMDASLHMARIGFQAISDVTAFALMPDDSHTRLKGKPGKTKAVAWADGMPLDAVKAVGKALGGSVNDVLLSCVAGAIGAYLRAKGDDPNGQEIRAMVPVNLRPLDKAYQLGNRFGLVPLVLPIGIENPVERMYAVRARMQELKGSFQPIMAFGLLAVAGLLIKPVQHAMLNLFAKKATAVMTNVPGPAKSLKFCGSNVERVMFWVPQSGDIGMGVSILTYAGKVQFGLITDSELCPDPEAIIAQFAPEFEKLTLMTLMLPWVNKDVEVG